MKTKPRIIDGIKLTPLFYSEITSSYLLYTVFQDKNITGDFIKCFLGIKATVNEVHREKSYKTIGSIDLFISFSDTAKRECALIIEVKVHDFLSATKDQTFRYYNAVSKDTQFDEVYLIYLTQFNNKNFSEHDQIERPSTIPEFEKLTTKYPHKKNHFRHVNWMELHDFIDQYSKGFTYELNLMISLQKAWIIDQINLDKEDHKVSEGQRGFAELFDGIDLRSKIPNGRSYKQTNRDKYEVDLLNSSQEELDNVLNLIILVCNSKSLDRKNRFICEPDTVIAVSKFLSHLSSKTDYFKILGFYSRLFDFVLNTDHILLNGTGGVGFSIIANLMKYKRISICTIYKSHKIVFSLKR